jgi:hypothetical protein
MNHFVADLGTCYTKIGHNQLESQPILIPSLQGRPKLQSNLTYKGGSTHSQLQESRCVGIDCILKGVQLTIEPIFSAGGIHNLVLQEKFVRSCICALQKITGTKDYGYAVDASFMFTCSLSKA